MNNAVESKAHKGGPSNGWEAARKQNLLHFAALSPTERVEWHAEMLSLLSLLFPDGLPTQFEASQAPCQQ